MWPIDSDEQAEWMRDLYDAARLIESLGSAFIRCDHPDEKEREQVNERLAGLVDDLRSMSREGKGGLNGWRPIDTAPRDGTVVDLWHEEYGRMCETWWDAADGVWVVTGRSNGFTHWMPMPEPPAREASRVRRPVDSAESGGDDDPA